MKVEDSQGIMSYINNHEHMAIRLDLFIKVKRNGGQIFEGM